MQRSGLIILVVAVVLLAGCAEPQITEEPTTSSQFRLPVSLNDVMVALVNEAADPIWVAAWRTPDTDQAWRELERRAYQLELAGTLIAHPGTGPLDDQWTAQEKWLHWSNRLRDSARAAITAVEQRDLDGIGAAGDMIVEVCEGCHIDFKLPLPTEGKFGELSPTESDFVE